MQERWRALWVLSAARVAMGFQFQAVGATAPLLRDAYGLALADVGWLVGLYLLPGLALALPGGMLSARLGDRRIAVAGTALMVAGGALCAFATTPAALEAGRVVGGVGGVLFNVTATKMVADWFAGREIELAMSVFVGTWPLGIGLGLLVLGATATAAGPAAAFALTGVLAMLSLLLVLLLYRPAPAAAATGALRWSALAPGDLGRLGLAASAWTAYNVGFALLVAFLPTLLADRGLPLAQSGAVTAVLTVTLIVSIPASGWLIGRGAPPFAVATAGLLCASGCLAAILAGGPPLPWLAVAGIVWGSAAGVLAAAPARFLSPQARAIGLGLFYTAFYLGMAVLPRAVGAVADALRSPGAILVAAIGMTLATIVLMAATERAIRRGAAARGARAATGAAPPDDPGPAPRAPR